MIKEGILTFKQTHYPQKMGWIKVKLGEVCKLKNGFAFKSSEYKTEGVPIIRISDIKEGIVTCKNSIKIETKAEYEDYLIEKNDILIAMSGATTGKFGIFKDKLRAYQNQRVGNFKLLDDEGLNKSFLFYQFYSLKRRIEKDAYGGAQPNISSKKIEEMEVIIAPLPEQRAIVSKIELLFSELDNGIANLKLAQEQLKVYRQAVLKKAFEGELTRKWREENPGVEDSICVLNKVKSQVSTQNQNKKIQNFQYDELPYGLPFKWNWASLSDVSISITDGDHQAPPKADSGVPFIVISNISSGKLDMSETMYVPEKYYENLAAKRKPQPRDLLYSVTGSYGIPILISENYRFCFQRHIALIRPHTEISSKYLYYVLKSPLVYKQATEVATGTAQLTVPLSGLRIIKVPLPPTEEQHAIIQEIETRLSVCDKIEQDIKENLEKAEALRQSILKKAFEGKLLNERELAEVRGAEDWEPAEVLLERIRVERAENGKK
jgi:type I restriction enzyme S subunit